jgi:hypothetical protein
MMLPASAGSAPGLRDGPPAAGRDPGERHGAWIRCSRVWSLRGRSPPRRRTARRIRPLPGGVPPGAGGRGACLRPAGLLRGALGCRPRRAGGHAGAGRGPRCGDVRRLGGGSPQRHGAPRGRRAHLLLVPGDRGRRCGQTGGGRGRARDLRQRSRYRRPPPLAARRGPVPRSGAPVALRLGAAGRGQPPRSGAADLSFGACDAASWAARSIRPTWPT